MATELKMKRSSVASKIPTTSQLELGEIAINTYDGKMYIKKDDGTAAIVEIGSGGGATAIYERDSFTATSNQTAFTITSNADVIEVYMNGLILNETDDYTIANNVITLQNGATTGDELEVINYISASILDTNAVVDDITFNDNDDNGTGGTLLWDGINETLKVDLDANNELLIGQEQQFYVKASAAIAKGDLVMFNGAQGDHLLAVKADQSAAGFRPEWVMGIAKTALSTNDFGYVTSYGKITGLDTSSYSVGDLLFMDVSTAGALSTTEPTPSQGHNILVAAVTNAHANQGSLIVRPTHRYDTDDVAEGSTNLYYTDARVDTYSNSGSLSGLSVGGNIAVTGTVDGRNVATDGTKLDTIETNAKDDQNASEVPFTNTTSGLTATDVQDAIDEVEGRLDTAETKLSGIEVGATADQTASEIKTAYESNSNTNAFTDAEKTKLSGIEANADVTDATNVDAAGAVMNSDTSVAAMSFVIDEDTMSSNLATKVPTQQSVKAYVDTEIAGLVDSAPGTLDTLNELAAALGDDPSFATTVTNSIATKLPLAGGTMTGAINFVSGQTFDGRDVSVDGSKLDGIESNATADQTAAEIKTAYESNSNTNAYTDSEKTKLSGIETGATADQTASEILTAVKTVDGSGSGLDADTVDGIQASSFVRSDQNDTMSGTYTITGDLTVSGGDITLGGTGRIQGIDTVTSGTDAANKDYVDNAVSGSSGGISAGQVYFMAAA